MSATSPVTVCRLHSVGESQLEQLARLLVDCVEGGASVSFMLPLTLERARGFWQQVADDVLRGQRVLLVAKEADEIVGTVQLALDVPENQPHRADVAKMLVLRRMRRRGVGALLMREVEMAALELGKTLLVLDTSSEEAERLYRRLGWQPFGTVPGYALWPGGGRCAAHFFYRELDPAPPLQRGMHAGT